MVRTRMFIVDPDDQDAVGEAHWAVFGEIRPVSTIVVVAPRVWALREDFSAYDAAYLALAEALEENGVPLLTADARFARAAQVHGAVDMVLVA